jgi:hypothetical protein
MSNVRGHEPDLSPVMEHFHTLPRSLRIMGKGFGHSVSAIQIISRGVRGIPTSSSQHGDNLRPSDAEDDSGAARAVWIEGEPARTGPGESAVALRG